MNRRVTIGASVPYQLADRLEQEAIQNDKTLSAVVTAALNHYYTTEYR